MLYFFGDIIEDTYMVPKGNMQNTITVGFLDKDIEKNFNKYKDHFDIVLTNNASFNDVLDIINIENV